MVDIAIDAGSSPTLVTGSGSSVSTASFTRPAGGLLVAMVYTITSTTYTVTGGGLTWTVRAATGGAIWTAPVTGSGSMTVTIGNLTDVQFFGKAAALKVIGLTGQAPSAPIGSSGNGSSVTNNLIASGYTSTVDGSRGFFSAVDDASTGSATSTDTGFAWSVTTAFSITRRGIFAHKAANTATSGSPVTFNADAAGTGTADWDWCALEIVPETIVRQRAVVSRSAVHRAASW